MSCCSTLAMRGFNWRQRRQACYGLLILDAFSSDVIPVHLMTSEAMSLYRSKLAPDGVLAFHVSNRHLQLGPVLGRLAAHHGLIVLERIDYQQSSADIGKRPSKWVVMARDLRSLGPLASKREMEGPRRDRLNAVVDGRLHEHPIGIQSTVIARRDVRAGEDDSGAASR